MIYLYSVKELRLKLKKDIIKGTELLFQRDWLRLYANNYGVTIYKDGEVLMTNNIFTEIFYHKKWN